MCFVPSPGDLPGAGDGTSHRGGIKMREQAEGKKTVFFFFYIKKINKNGEIEKDKHPAKGYDFPRGLKYLFFFFFSFAAFLSGATAV